MKKILKFGIKLCMVFILLFILVYLYTIMGPKIANLIFKDKKDYIVFEFGETKNEYSIGLNEKIAIYYDYGISKLCPTYIKWKDYFIESITYNKDEFSVEKLTLRDGCKLNHYYLVTPKKTGRLVITAVKKFECIGEPVNSEIKEKLKQKSTLVVNVHQ